MIFLLCVSKHNFRTNGMTPSPMPLLLTTTPAMDAMDDGCYGRAQFTSFWRNTDIPKYAEEYASVRSKRPSQTRLINIDSNSIYSLLGGAKCAPQTQLVNSISNSNSFPLSPPASFRHYNSRYMYENMYTHVRNTRRRAIPSGPRSLAGTFWEESAWGATAHSATTLRAPLAATGSRETASTLTRVTSCTTWTCRANGCRQGPLVMGWARCVGGSIGLLYYDNLAFAARKTLNNCVWFQGQVLSIILIEQQHNSVHGAGRKGHRVGIASLLYHIQRGLEVLRTW